MKNMLQQVKAWRLRDREARVALTPDELSRRWPNGYLLLVVLFTLFGYVLTLGFPLLALALLIGLPGALSPTQDAMDWAHVALLLGSIIGAGAMTAFLARLKMPLPSGRPLEGEERVPLDNLIESLPAESRLSRPHIVRITDRHQVASVCVPRNGFALFNRKALLLGLPTLQALTTKQAEAALRRVLCSPNTLKGWVLHAIHCQHQCWQQYHVAYRGQGAIAARIMAALFNAYWPAYQRLSAPALRWNELERDTLLNQQICVDNVLEWLAVDTVVSRYLDDVFWPAMFEGAKDDARPPHPHALFKDMLHEQLSRNVVNGWLDDALHAPQPEQAVMPAMQTRLANLGSQRLESVLLGDDNAAQALLQASLSSIVSQIDKVWRLGIRHHWLQAHETHAQRRARLVALRRRAQTQSIKGQDAMTYAKLAKHYLAPDEAVAVYQQIAAMNPDDAKILLGVGRLLLSYGSEAGASMVKRATQLDGRLSAKARKILARFPISSQSGAAVASTAGNAA
jgi:hypothetical protein